MIGEPFMAQAMVVRGYYQDRWEAPMFEFTWQPGGGIPFDMGGYYLHALVSFLGPVARVAGFAKTIDPERIIKNVKNPRYGEKGVVNNLSNLTGSMEFASGVMGGITFAAEGFGETTRIEIYGTEGTLSCPDPNQFGGPVYLRRSGEGEFRQMPLTHGFTEGCCRGLGVADMAWGIVNGRPHRAHGDMGYHVFEMIHGIWQGSLANKAHVMESTCAQPAVLPSGYVEPGMDEYSLSI